MRIGFSTIPALCVVALIVADISTNVLAESDWTDDTSTLPECKGPDSPSCDAGTSASASSKGPDSLSESQCTLYLAPSTIPHAGLGVFTGVALEEGDTVGYGDPAVPIIDIDFHNDGKLNDMDYHWLLSEYVWSSPPMAAAEGDTVSMFVPGIGAMPNCHFRLRNIGETAVVYDTAGVRRVDPGVGAFTGYMNRTAYAEDDVAEGSELFVDYGQQWFLTREYYMGLIPLLQSYPAATLFLSKFETLVDSISETLDEKYSSAVLSDLWDTVLSSPYKSRPQAALPKTYDGVERAMDVGIQTTELEHSIRPLEYLQEHGKCLDQLRPGNSTIPHAGHGAFATRFVPKGGFIAPIPLAHIPDRDTLIMYEDTINPNTGKEVRDLTKPPRGHQLLLNYCFGHSSSTLLLCPYGSGTTFINHDAQSPNAKIVWSSDAMYNNASWFNEPVHFFDNIWTSGLMFELIALRDVHPDEEVTIDYGREWQVSWDAHVRNWVPPEGSEEYVTPEEIHANFGLPLRHNKGLIMRCGLEMTVTRRTDFDKGHYFDKTRDFKYGAKKRVKKILAREESEEEPGIYLYTLLVTTVEGETEGNIVLMGVPRNAVTFIEEPYTTDIHTVGAFRHEMMIPDEMFPDAWKNIMKH